MRATLFSLLPIALIALFGTTAHAADTPVAKRSLPQLTVDLNSLTYPSSAQRAGIHGRVLMAFTITKKGRADDLEVVSAEPAGEFDSVAIKAIKQVRFTVPDDWEATGGSKYRFQLSVLFKLNPCVAPVCIAPTAHDTADDYLVIGAEAK